MRNRQKNEPAHDKTYNKICATSEDSDQPAHPRSLIRVFADRMCLLQSPGCPQRDKREPSPYWVDVQADLSLLLHSSYCRFSCALAQMVSDMVSQNKIFSFEIKRQAKPSFRAMSKEQ